MLGLASFGLKIAQTQSGGRVSRALSVSVQDTNPKRQAAIPGPAFCSESRSLLDAFGEAVRELLLLHEVQFRAIVAGDSYSDRFDLLIHMANEKKHVAKYAYLRHLETHGCSTYDGTEQS